MKQPQEEDDRIHAESADVCVTCLPASMSYKEVGEDGRRLRRRSSWSLSNLLLAVLVVAYVGSLLRDELRASRRAPFALQEEFEAFRMAEDTVSVVPMHGKTFGADVYGFDAQYHLHDERVSARLRLALDRHLVLRFHSVSRGMSPERHVEFTRGFGPVDPEISAPPKYLLKGKFNSPDQVARAAALGLRAEDLGSTMRAAMAESTLPREVTRVVKAPSDVAAFGEGWHTDLSYLAATPHAAMLVSRELPPPGLGNTHFLDMRHVYEQLPEDVRLRIEGLRANHTDGDERWTMHPVVRHDHRYGDKALFVNKAFSRSIVGAGADAALLPFLLDHIEGAAARQPAAALDLTWEDGQVLMWDNRFTQHAAQGTDYHGFRREMHRTITSGTVPF